MFARKIHVEVIKPEGMQACPLPWLDSFCMRSFTGREAFDETLPVQDGLLEASRRVNIDALQRDLEDWLTRKFGEGKPVKLRLAEVRKEEVGNSASPGLPTSPGSQQI